MKRPPLLPMVRRAVLDSLGGYVRSPRILDEIDAFIVPPALGDRAGVLGGYKAGTRGRVTGRGDWPAPGRLPYHLQRSAPAPRRRGRCHSGYGARARRMISTEPWHGLSDEGRRNDARGRHRDDRDERNRSPVKASLGSSID